jgi:BASS family bile acid:Na+ symporter
MDNRALRQVERCGRLPVAVYAHLDNESIEVGLLIPPRFLLYIFVALVMVSIGLRVHGAELFSLLRDRRLLGRSLLANCVLVPMLGFVLAWTIPMDAQVRTGIMLLAAVPGTPAALQFTRTARDRLAFVAGLTFILSLAAIAIAPVAVEVVPHIESQYRPTMDLIMSLLLQIVLPMGVGLLLARRLPSVAAKTVLPLDIAATVVFLLLMWETRTLRREAFRTMGTGPAVAMFTLLVLAMMIGWWLGGPDRESRRVLATSTSMRNVVVCFFIARYWFPGTKVYLVPVAYLGMMVPVNLLFTLYQKRRLRKLAAAQAQR